MTRSLLLSAMLVLSATSVSAKEFDGADWGWSIAAGTGGAAALGLGLGLTGLLSDDSYAAIGTLVFFGPIGADLGATGAVYAYGQLTDHEGSFWATLGGGTAGALAGVGLFAASIGINSDLAPLGIAFVAIGPGVGATIGYWLSLDKSSEPTARTSGALIDYGSTGWQVAVPLVRTGATLEGDFALSVPVLGGRW